MSSKSAATSESLLDELQTTLAHGTVARRVETLRRVTDLFINGAVDYSDEQIGLFDDVFQCLMHQHRNTRPRRCSPIVWPRSTRAPPRTIRALAFDDLIEIAAPVLSQIGTARRRRADRDRAQQEPGASDGDFDPKGAERRGDRRAGAARQRRGDPEHRQQSRRGILRARVHPAGQSRRGRRQPRDLHRPAADHSPPSLPETAREGVGDGAGAARGRQPARWRGTCHRRCGKRRGARAPRPRPSPGKPPSPTRWSNRCTRTAGSTSIRSTAFAEAGKFDETNAAIAALANVSVSIAENMMVETRAEGVMILAKVSGMSWSTVKAIINMRDDLSGMEPRRSAGLQGHLRTAAALDRPAGAALPPHAADRGTGGVRLVYRG